MTDAERLDWLERVHTLHRTIEILYVVDGYKLTYCHDYSPLMSFEGETVRECIDKAMRMIP